MFPGHFSSSILDQILKEIVVGVSEIFDRLLRRILTHGEHPRKLLSFYRVKLPSQRKLRGFLAGSMLAAPLLKPPIVGEARDTARRNKVLFLGTRRTESNTVR